LISISSRQAACLASARSRRFVVSSSIRDKILRPPRQTNGREQRSEKLSMRANCGRNETWLLHDHEDAGGDGCQTPIARVGDTRRNFAATESDFRLRRAALTNAERELDQRRQ
jgi:hypothetical protein